MFEYVGLLPLLPMLAALWIGLGYVAGGNRGEAGETATARIALAGVGTAFLFSLALGIEALIQGPPGQIGVFGWFSSGTYSVDVNFYLDTLALSLSLLVAYLCLVTVRFSVNYMHREPGFQRFFLVLCLFAGGMQLIVTAGNAALTFVGWELAGVSSYLLIAYRFERPRAGQNAARAYVTNRVGDAGFLLGIFLCFKWLGGVDWLTVEERASALDPLRVGLIGLAFLPAALAKSAQPPFSPWIGRALEGPTPSSGLFYGALLVHAGVYLLIRLEPVISQAPPVAALVAACGLLGALFGWLCGLVQTDVKSSLVFSTIAQVGLMFIWCALGWTTLAGWHLAAHALWRAYQFLHAPGLPFRVGGAGRPVPGWLASRPRLHDAALQRFWLDPLADWLLVQPTMSLARDLENLDEKVVTRMIGKDEWPLRMNFGADSRDEREATGEHVARGRGLLGGLLERIAAALHWFEVHLILRGSGEGLFAAIRRIGVYAARIEQLLAQPRYLMLLIMATFAVIL